MYVIKSLVVLAGRAIQARALTRPGTLLRLGTDKCRGCRGLAEFNAAGDHSESCLLQMVDTESICAKSVDGYVLVRHYDYMQPREAESSTCILV